jgi:hypothetical protein
VALTDDQRAMLRLLAQREEGYEDIAALKGMSVEEVRAEVRAALAQLAEDREAGETSPPSEAAGETSLGAPSGSSEEPPAGSPRTDEGAPATAGKEPAAASPPDPEPAVAASAAKPQADSSPPAKSGAAGSFPRRPLAAVPPQRRRLLLLTGGALGVVAVVLIAIAVFGGGSDSGSGSTAPSTELASGGENGESPKITQAVLEPASGESGSGHAVFGRLGKEVVLQVTATGLKPTASGESYTVWLFRTPKLSLRVGSATVDDSGRLGARFPIPTELLAYIASGAFTQIYVSRTADAAYQREVAQAKKNKGLPRYTGETVLTGEITGPVVKK